MSDVFQFILRNSYEHVFNRTPQDDCFSVELEFQINDLVIFFAKGGLWPYMSVSVSE